MEQSDWLSRWFKLSHLQISINYNLMIFWFQIEVIDPRYSDGDERWVAGYLQCSGLSGEGQRICTRTRLPRWKFWIIIIFYSFILLLMGQSLVYKSIKKKIQYFDFHYLSPGWLSFITGIYNSHSFQCNLHLSWPAERMKWLSSKSSIRTRHKGLSGTGENGICIAYQSNGTCRNQTPVL